MPPREGRVQPFGYEPSARGVPSDNVKDLQRLCIAYGLSVGRCGADGKLGPDTLRALQQLSRHPALRETLGPRLAAVVNTLGPGRGQYIHNNLLVEQALGPATPANEFRQQMLAAVRGAPAVAEALVNPLSVRAARELSAALPGDRVDVPDVPGVVVPGDRGGILPTHPLGGAIL